MTYEDQNSYVVVREIEVLNLLNITENKEIKRKRFFLEDKFETENYNPDDYINYEL
jgi:hypothetical protein